MKPLSDDEWKRLAGICRTIIYYESSIARLRKPSEIDHSQIKIIACKLLAQDAEIKELKDVLEAEGYRFPEREFPDEEPPCQSE